MKFDKKILLDENEMPSEWYNIIPDLPEPLPVFPKALIKQEMSDERWIRIPEEVKEVYRIWRPTPLIRAERLEKALKTPARIYFKYEGASPPGSHKPNTAVAQAYYNAKEGVERLTTETGAGQWGSALCFACKLFDLRCMVYMVKVSYMQKPYRRVLMETWGGEVVPSPSQRTEVGKKILSEDPDNPGSLGIAISEAIEDAAKHEDTKYSLSGLCYPFVRDAEKEGIEIIAVEPKACPTLTSGEYKYDYGDTAGLTPLLKMFTLGETLQRSACS